MKYNELDLNYFIPDGLRVNDSDIIEKRNAINTFFLRAFELWYRNNLQDHTINVQAPYSMEALMACSDLELDTFLEELGAHNYAVDLETPAESVHEAKAAFVYALKTCGYGTVELIDAIVKFAFNRDSVRSFVDYENCPDHHFNLDIRGDVSSIDIMDTIKSRIIYNLNKYNLVTEKLLGVNLMDLVEAEKVYVSDPLVVQTQLIRTVAKRPAPSVEIVAHLNRRYLTTGQTTYIYDHFSGTQAINEYPGKTQDRIPYDPSKTYTIIDRGKYGTTTGSMEWGLSISGLEIIPLGSTEKYLGLSIGVGSSTTAGNSYILKLRIT